MNKISQFVNKYLALIVAAVGLILPQIFTNTYLIHIMLMVIIYAILACSLNIAVGMTGLSNLAHATFFGIGAYAAAILNSRFSAPFYVTIFAGMLVAILFGVVLGAPTLRLKGVFLALVTTGFGQVMRIIEINWVSLTNGPMGISGIDPARIGAYRFSRTAYVYYGLLVLVLTIYVAQRIMHSKMGRAFFSIKYDETAARSLGVNVTMYKILAYVISAGLAGMAGSVYAHYISFISPDTFTAADSTTVLCMVILGGAGTLLGPLIGAILLTLTPEIFRFAQLYRIIFIGVIMVVGVIASERKWSVAINEKLSGWFRSLRRNKGLENGGRS